jgi:hypothetical protein
MAKSKKPNKTENQLPEEEMEKLDKVQNSIQQELDKLKTLKKEWDELVKRKEQGLEVDEKRLELLEQENKSLDTVDKKIKKLSGDWNRIEKKMETSKESMMDGFESIFGKGFGTIAKAFKAGPKKMNEQGDITTPVSDLKNAFSTFTKEMGSIFNKTSQSMEKSAEKAAQAQKATTDIPAAKPTTKTTPSSETKIKSPRITRRGGRASRRGGTSGINNRTAATGGVIPPPTEQSANQSTNSTGGNSGGRRRSGGRRNTQSAGGNTIQPASPASPTPTPPAPPAPPVPPTRTPTIPSPGGGAGGVGGFGKAMGNMKNVASGAIKGLGGAGKALASLGSKAIPVVGQVMAVVDAVKAVGAKFKDGTAATWAFALGLDGLGAKLGRLTDEYRDSVIEQKIVEPVRQAQQDEQALLGFQQSKRADVLQYNQNIEKENLQIKQGYAKEDVQFKQGLTKDRISLERQKEDDAVNFGFSLVEDRMGLEKSMQEDMINYEYSLKEDKMNLAHQEAMKDMQAEFNARKAFFMAGMRDQQTLMGVSARALEAAGSSAQEVIQTASGLATSMGLGLNQGIKLGTTVSLISKRLGIGAEEVGKIGEAFRLIGGLSAEQALNLQTSTAAMAKANGLNPQAVMKEMAAATEDAYSYNIKSAEALAEQVTAVTAIGASFSKIAKAGKNMVMNYKDSIKAEMQLSTLLGEQVDLSEARAAFASGDVAGGTAALQAQLGDMDIASMDMFQKEALSQALGGMDLAEIMKVGEGGKEDGKGFGPEKNMADATAKFSGAVSQFKTDAVAIGQSIANGALAMDKSQAVAEQAAEQAFRLKMLEHEQQKRADMLVFEQQWKMKEMLFEQQKREYQMSIDQNRRYQDMIMERDFQLETLELERAQRLDIMTMEQKHRLENIMAEAQNRREQSDLNQKQKTEMQETQIKAKAYGSWFNRNNPFSDYNLDYQSTTQTAGLSTFAGMGGEQALQQAGFNLNMGGTKDVKQQDKEYWDKAGGFAKFQNVFSKATGGNIVKDMFGAGQAGQFKDYNENLAYQKDIGKGGQFINTMPGTAAGSYQMPTTAAMPTMASIPYQMPTAGVMPTMASMPYQMPAGTMAGSTPNMTANVPTGLPYAGSMMDSMNFGIGAWNNIKGQQFDIPNLVGGKMPKPATGGIKLPELQPYGMPQQSTPMGMTTPATTPTATRPVTESAGFISSLWSSIVGSTKKEVAPAGQSSSSTSPFQEKLFQKLVYMSGNLEKILTRTDKTAAYMYVVSTDIKSSLKKQDVLNTNTSEMVRLNKNIQNLIDAMLTNNQNEGSITLSIDGKQVSRVIKRRADNERATSSETDDNP